MRKKIFAYGIMLLMISTCTLQLMSRQNNIFKIASQGEGEGEFLTNNNLNQKKVYLTFDDGPSDHTQCIPTAIIMIRFMQVSMHFQKI